MLLCSVTSVLRLVLLPALVRSDIVVPALASGKKALIASEGDINFGFLSGAHYSSDNIRRCDIVSSTSCTVALESIRFALRDLNARTDLLPNVSVGHVVVDGCGTAVRALEVSVHFVNKDGRSDRENCSAARGAASDNSGANFTASRSPVGYDVVGIIGPSNSAAASMASSFLGIFQIPQIGVYATSDTLSDKTVYEYFLRLVSPDSCQVQAMLDLCQSSGWSYVSLVYSEGTYGENAASKVDHYLRSKTSPYSICLATSQKIYADATAPDMNRIVATLLEFPNMRVILLFLAGTHRYTFFDAVRVLAGPGRFMWLAGDFFGFYLNTPYLDVVKGGIYFDHPAVAIPRFTHFMKSLNPWHVDGNVWLTEYWESSQKCSLSDPMNATGKACSPSISLTPNVCPYFWPVTCRIYDAVHVMADAIHRLVTDLCPEAFEQKWMLRGCIRGPTLLRYLYESDLDGLIGHIQFDAYGNVQEDLVINQYQQISGSYRAVQVGTWRQTTDAVLFNTTQVSWAAFGLSTPSSASNGSRIPLSSVCALPCQEDEYVMHGDVPCCWTCIKCRNNEIVSANRSACQPCPAYFWPANNATSCQAIEQTYLLVSHPISACLLALAGIGSLLSAAVTVVYVAKRRHKLVMATYVPLSVVILAGTLVVSLAVVAFVLSPNVRHICTVRSFGFYCGVNLIYSPLFVKNILTYRIFTSRSPNIAFKSTKFQLLFTFSSFACQVLLTSVSEYVSPSSPNTRMPNSYDNYVELFCSKSTVWFIVPLAYNILLMLVCVVIGFVTRKLPDNFNESWFIFVSVSTTLFAWVVFIPAYFTSYYAYLQPAILGFCLVLITFITLGCQFLPIIYAVTFVPTNQIVFFNKGTVSVAPNS